MARGVKGGRSGAQRLLGVEVGQFVELSNVHASGPVDSASASKVVAVRRFVVRGSISHGAVSECGGKGQGSMDMVAVVAAIQ
eukprot:5907452-Alexandrium_andersonii.AAC.1